MINIETERSLQYYVGKLCTIMTQPMALPLDVNTHHQWFTIEVTKVTHEAIFGLDPARKTLMTFFLPVIGIAEEQVVPENHPNYQDIKKEAMESKPSPMPAPSVSLDSLQAQATALRDRMNKK